MKRQLTILLMLIATLGAMAQSKGVATPLKRGLMAISLDGAGSGTGNLVSWRSRESDGRNYKFKLYRGKTATAITTKIQNDYIIGKTNYLDKGTSVSPANASTYYRLEVYNDKNQLVEQDTCATVANQVKYVDLEGGAPTDSTSAGATYTPNDASFCDMDGDGEYEIVLKWSPSNEKDAASSGTTSPEFYGCYKLSGKKLWLMHTGPNMFASAHTSPFIAWDMDGDGFGEFMVKTAPGAIDGQGNYVLMDGDSPTVNLKNSNGKQVSGPEYLTVFDGRNGAELKTIAYHTNYAAGANYWGDAKQNRSERYLAALAYLDGPDKNPSAIFARGYYAGAFVGAADWDGENLSWRWVHKAYSASNGEVVYADGTKTKLTKTVYGDGAHWISVADVNGDGKQEITYGSSALKPDGTTLYRTGLGHGDALHVSDFDPNRPGLECFMAHEHSPYGVDYRDATTGEILLRKTASGDTGRGFMANFDPERDDALWQASAWANMWDGSGNSVVESQTHGGGAGVQDRVYWTGTLADDFWGKSVLETWNGTSLGRILACVNNTNYTIGTTNNDSKNNACCIGDILGDWREEIICWTGDATNGYKLTINCTNYTTDYIVPHLMDDLGYRAQVVNENCCYNQPPHLDYNLRASKKVTRELTEGGETEKYGKYWDCAYNTYPVILPKGVMGWVVKGREATDSTVTLTQISTGSSAVVIPANTAILYNSATPDVTLVPTAKGAMTITGTNNLTGLYCDSVVVDGRVGITNYKYFTFKNGDRGLGFYHVDGKTTVSGGTGYLKLSSTLGKASSYALPEEMQAVKVIKGDVNGDGNVDINDVNAIIGVICGDSTNDKADVNGDGIVDINDVNMVIGIICGEE